MDVRGGGIRPWILIEHNKVRLCNISNVSRGTCDITALGDVPGSTRVVSPAGYLFRFFFLPIRKLRAPLVGGFGGKIQCNCVLGIVSYSMYLRTTVHVLHVSHIVFCGVVDGGGVGGGAQTAQSNCTHACGGCFTLARQPCSIYTLTPFRHANVISQQDAPHTQRTLNGAHTRKVPQPNG